MAVKVKTEKDGRIGIIEIKGSLVGDNETDRFREAYVDLIEQGNKFLVINLMKVNYINSSGIGALIGAHASYTKIDGEVKLAGLSNNVQNLLVVTKLIDIFDTHDTVEEATKSFVKEKSLS
ncbi:MAG: STAS domain-containing protein [Ignavibacteriales bacterium]|nr:STAS domain-containing protein [Ignavibacteriales bacterium]